MSSSRAARPNSPPPWLPQGSRPRSRRFRPNNRRNSSRLSTSAPAASAATAPSDRQPHPTSLSPAGDQGGYTAPQGRSGASGNARPGDASEQEGGSWQDP